PRLAKRVVLVVPQLKAGRCRSRVDALRQRLNLDEEHPCRLLELLRVAQAVGLLQVVGGSDDLLDHPLRQRLLRMSLVGLWILDAAGADHLRPERRVVPVVAHGPQRGPRLATTVQGNDAQLAGGADALKALLPAGANLIVQGESLLQLAGLRLQLRQRRL